MWGSIGTEIICRGHGNNPYIIILIIQYNCYYLMLIINIQKYILLQNYSYRVQNYIILLYPKFNLTYHFHANEILFVVSATKYCQCIIVIDATAVNITQ